MKRRFLRIAGVALPVVIAAAFALSRLGSFLVQEDPLQHADAIIVLGGTMYERQMEAVDLFKAGAAPRIFLFREIADWGERELIARGVQYVRSVDLQIETMVRLGVPRDAIEALDQANSTANEAEKVRQLVVERRFGRVIVVTSKQHTRRARLVINRHLSGSGVVAIVRASRYDRTNTDRWWRDRPTIRFTIFESQRLLGYWLGVGD